MPATAPSKPRVFVDADVLFAAAAAPSEQGASLVILRMAEITLIEAVASQQVVVEAERNLAEKLPQTLPAFRLIVGRCLHVVPDPRPPDLLPHTGLADPKDVPILVAALREQYPWLVTFPPRGPMGNVRHLQPGHADVTVLRPGEFVSRVRDVLAHLPDQMGQKPAKASTPE